jgi:hypothetical protein
LLRLLMACCARCLFWPQQVLPIKCSVHVLVCPWTGLPMAWADISWAPQGLGYPWPGLHMAWFEHYLGCPWPGLPWPGLRIVAVLIACPAVDRSAHLLLCAWPRQPMAWSAMA